MEGMEAHLSCPIQGMSMVYGRSVGKILCLPGWIRVIPTASSTEV